MRSRDLELMLMYDISILRPRAFQPSLHQAPGERNAMALALKRIGLIDLDFLHAGPSADPFAGRLLLKEGLLGSR